MPQPVDLQTEIGRAAAAERIQQIADRASLAAQHRVSDEAQETRVQSETTTHQAEPKGPEVDRELRRRAPHSGRRRRRRDGAPHDHECDEAAHRFYTADEHEAVAEDPDGHQFDVSI